MIPKNRGENFSSGFLHSEFYLGRGEPLCPTPLIVALSLGHRDITRFRPWSPLVTGKTPKVAQMTGTVDVFELRSGILASTSWRASLPHVQIFVNDGPNPLT